MAQESIIVSDWPALMSSETAARYLSLDEHTLFQLATRFKTPAVDLEDELVRWRRQDLDKLIRKLPYEALNSPADRPVRKITLDKAQIEAIAEAVASNLERTADRPPRKLVSISEASTILGGRSSVYRMMGDGRLESTHIGRRTLIQMASIETILDDSSG